MIFERVGNYKIPDYSNGDPQTRIKYNLATHIVNIVLQFRFGQHIVCARESKVSYNPPAC